MKIQKKGQGGNLLIDSNFKPENSSDISIATMAYIGDAVFELMVRTHVATARKRKLKDIHLDTVELVRAKSQAKLVKKIADELSEEEHNIVRRGRNIKTTPAKNAEMIDYRMSTGFEALLGYLYLRGEKKRLNYLFQKALAPYKTPV